LPSTQTRLLVDKRRGQFTRRQFWFLERPINHRRRYCYRKLVPDSPRRWLAILQSYRAARLVPLIPAVKGRAGNSH
jgi:hypothetical protein